MKFKGVNNMKRFSYITLALMAMGASPLLLANSNSPFNAFEVNEHDLQPLDEAPLPRIDIDNLKYEGMDEHEHAANAQIPTHPSLLPVFEEETAELKNPLHNTQTASSADSMEIDTTPSAKIPAIPSPQDKKPEDANKTQATTSAPNTTQAPADLAAPKVEPPKIDAAKMEAEAIKKELEAKSISSTTVSKPVTAATPTTTTPPTATPMTATTVITPTIPSATLPTDTKSTTNYGTNYGSPEAKVTSATSTSTSTLNTTSTSGVSKPIENTKDQIFFSGPGVSIPPTVMPTSKETVKTIRVDMVHKNIDLDNGLKFAAWTFGDEVPGPIIHVNQGDKIDFTLRNRSNESTDVMVSMPHGIDLEAAQVSPDDKYRTILPGQILQFNWYANYPGVYLYQCATSPENQSSSKGMYGMIIVEPTNGYPTKVDREFAIVQSEFYLDDKGGVVAHDLDMNKMRANTPTQVVFNGKINRHMKETLVVKPLDRVRMYVLNAGPNNASTFHVDGTIFDRVWMNGNPANELRGLNSIVLGPSSSAIVEFVIPEAGIYTFMDHSFNNADKGAKGVLDASGGVKLPVATPTTTPETKEAPSATMSTPMPVEPSPLDVKSSAEPKANKSETDTAPKATKKDKLSKKGQKSDAAASSSNKTGTQLNY